MKALRTLVLVILMPVFLLPAGLSVCVCSLLHGNAGLHACATCCETCSDACPRSPSHETPRVSSGRDCFLHVPTSEPTAKPDVGQGQDRHVATLIASSSDGVQPWCSPFDLPCPRDARALCAYERPRTVIPPLRVGSLPLRL
jgi:hypothetical protein